MPKDDKPHLAHSSTGSMPGNTNRVGISTDSSSLVASAALIAGGVLIEPELLGGALLGAGVVYGLPVVGRLLRPVVKNAIRLGFWAASSVSEMASDATHQVQDMVSDARSEYQHHEGPNP